MGTLPAYAEYPYPCELTDENSKVISHVYLDIDFDYIEMAVLTNEVQFSLPAKSLVLRFKTPQTIVSTLDGWKHEVRAVGNHYTPPEAWQTAHDLGLGEMNRMTTEYLGLSPESSGLLYTGADVGKYAYIELSDEHNGKELRVGVLATAGVRSNAMRAGFDSGNYWKPGTINLILVANHELAPQAMLQMLIVATEAKTAALEDLDIRSSYSKHPATGTGTDNIIVVGGEGATSEYSVALTMAGGHTKLGELTGKAVHQAVTEAIEKQNKLEPERDIITRLEEHGVKLETLRLDELNDHQAQQLVSELKLLLHEPYYASALASFMAVGDANMRGLVDKNQVHSDWAEALASKIAGKEVSQCKPLLREQDINPLLKLTLDAMLNGIALREGIEIH